MWSIQQLHEYKRVLSEGTVEDSVFHNHVIRSQKEKDSGDISYQISCQGFKVVSSKLIIAFEIHCYNAFPLRI